ncbi:FBP domain-containing protein [Amnibacterium kyonggiense]|uniref:Treble-clef zinc-finger protein n=1 Tax=Amnibacterium kyonggiense TaxID=595671 RepID=A0A4R7FIW6_9MICO|nr:FBP domain-containing protein [Amnibacterium kyonggiense]TDS75572.1 treble-clef zinc-finger protein [Amnibacterium kyonggiense]
MHALDEGTLRASFVNTTRKEVSDLTLPADFAALDWSRLDLLGWRDPKLAKRAYVVVPTDDGTVGVLLRRADATPVARAQCSWCQDVRLPNDVVLYTAKRAGAAGRRGDTVGVLVCESFQCSANVRKPPPIAYLGFDVEAAREERIRTLRERAAGFAAAVLA